MILRRDFLRRLAATAAGLLVADDVAELVASRRKLWPGWSPASPAPWCSPGSWCAELVDSNGTSHARQPLQNVTTVRRGGRVVMDCADLRWDNLQLPVEVSHIAILPPEILPPEGHPLAGLRPVRLEWPVRVRIPAGDSLVAQVGASGLVHFL